MENKIKVAIFFLFILLLSFVGLVVYGLINKKDNNPVPNIPNTTTTTVPSSLKIDSTKEWVYIAEYSYEVESDNFTDLYDTPFNVKDIIAPYINIDSSDAEETNKQIKELFYQVINEYNVAFTNKEATSTLNYESYLNGDILSVVLEHLDASQESDYYTYNFNIKTGNLLTFEDIYQIAGLTDTNIESKVEVAITNYINDFLVETNQNVLAEKFISPSIEFFYNPESISYIGYFLDKDKNFNIATILSLPIGHGDYYRILTIK